MSLWTEEAVAAIEKQQGTERTPAWMVGEQLKDMVRCEPHLAELICQDLEKKELSLTECEKKIKAYADKHQSKGFACVTPVEAERIIREFYGLPEREWRAGSSRPTQGDGGPGAARPTRPILDLADFL